MSAKAAGWILRFQGGSPAYVEATQKQIDRMLVRNADILRKLEEQGVDMTEARRWWERKLCRRRRMAQKRKRGWA